MTAEPVATAERHATWKELFFDLVVVAGIGQLAHLLHEDTEPTTLGLYAVLYLAFWISWAGFAVYGNVAGDGARTRVLITAMLGLSVMAASVAGIHESRASAFVIAYVLLRWYAGALVQRGKVLLDWPLAQFGLGALPWLVSLWVEAPYRYWLWGAGIVIDLTILLLTSGERALAGAEQRVERVQQSPRARGRTLLVEGTHTEEEHLSERLGLFVIIVLGEGLIQIIDAASDSERWDLHTAVVALGAFALLAAVWTAGLLHGTSGIPQLRPHVVAPRIVMVLHALLTGALAALAAALGVTVEHVQEELPVEYRALLCGAVAAYCAIGAATAVLVGKGRRWFLLRGVPSVVLPVAIFLALPHAHVGVLVWLLVAVVAWLVLEKPADGRSRRSAEDRAEHRRVRAERRAARTPGSAPGR